MGGGEKKKKKGRGKKWKGKKGRELGNDDVSGWYRRGAKPVGRRGEENIKGEAEGGRLLLLYVQFKKKEKNFKLYKHVQETPCSFLQFPPTTLISI